MVIAPLACAVTVAVGNASFDPLGRDQGIFQYVAWAILKGEKAYRDVRDVNGPLAPLVHLVFQLLGGADEHRFRVLDLTASGLAYAAAGACLPGSVAPIQGARPDRSTRASWALAAVAALFTQYLLYFDYWDNAQRESFCTWFVLPASGLVLLAHRLADDGDRRARAAFAVAGALSVVPCAAKPTFAVVFVVHALAILVERSRLPRARRIGLFAGGALLAAAAGSLVVSRIADVTSYATIWGSDVTTMYRFIWPRSLSEIVEYPQSRSFVAWAVVCAPLGAGLAKGGVLRPAAATMALVPGAALLSLLAQGKGFFYHFHPIAAGVYFAALVALVAVAEAATTPASRVVVAVGALVACLPHAGALGGSAHGVRTCRACTPEELASPAYLRRWRRRDYFPDALHAAARHLRETTPPDARVQTYGMDPYLLFLAQRLSATPYVYAYDLNADYALMGNPRALVPTEAQRARIRALRDAHEEDLVQRLEASPPAAFAVLDRSPLMTFDDALADFALHCPDAFAVLRDGYRASGVFGEVRVYVRRDAHAAVTSAQTSREPGGAR